MAYLQIGRWLLLSWAIPVVGGVIGYWRVREQDRRLAQILLVGTFGLPTLFAGTALGYMIMPVAGAAGAVLAAVTVSLLATHVLKENPYRRLIWACYLYLPAALYLYMGSYKDQPRLRRAIKTFGIGATIIGMLTIVLFGTLPFISGVLAGFM